MLGTFTTKIWKNFLEDGDIEEEALNAAHAVGDDAIQSKMQGHVFRNHLLMASEQQRKYWFMKDIKRRYKPRNTLLR
jgi:predicted metalloprotease